MSADDRPPMPAAPPPSSEPPAPTPVSLPPAPTTGPLVDSVPGSTSSEPAERDLGGLILPSDLPTWAPRDPAPPAPEPPSSENTAPESPAPANPAPGNPAPADDAGDTIPVSTFLSQLSEAQQLPPAEDAGDTIAASGGSFDHLILPPPAPPVAPPEPAGSPVGEPAPPLAGTAPEWAAETQRGWLGSDGVAAAPIAPPAFAPPGSTPPVAAPPGFTSPGFTAPGFTPPGSTPPSGGAHAVPGPASGRGKLAALIGGIVVLAALVVGGFFLFHSSSKKTPIAAPTPSAAISQSPVAAPTTAPAPTSAAPSPTVDANLGGMQAKALQASIIKPLKSLVALDASSAGAEESCLVDQTSAFASRKAERVSLLAQLRKLDVTAMQGSMVWKGLLEQAMIKDIAVDTELVAFSKDLKTTCKTATVKNDAHYKKAIVNRMASVALQKKFVASYNPVAKIYNVPMQSAGNL